MASGQSALRALLTIDAGATIALLTMVGHLWDSKTLTRTSSELFVGALQPYILATFLALIAYGAIFITNCLSSEGWEKVSYGTFFITVVVGFTSAGYFFVGCQRAVEAFHSVTKLLPG
ncbi:MAG TPA: hypothetical protein VF381_00105 [Thermoanaerobaculia bacterium]